MRAHARPFDLARFNHRFEGGSLAPVLDQLAAFQNADGGFGRGLEPDIRLAASSPLATSVALQRLRELGVGAGHQLVRGAIAYLAAAFDPALPGWEFVPPEVEDCPRAPWLQYRGRPTAFTPNPSAELCGHLLHYGALGGAAAAARLLEHALAHLAAAPALDMHEVLCYLWLHDAAGLGATERTAAAASIARQAQAVVTRDPGAWSSYCAKPLWFAPRPDALLAGVLAADVARNLDHEIATQHTDGSWHPFWSWEAEDAVAWKGAKREWQGVLTMSVLSALAAHGRLPCREAAASPRA